MPLPRSEILALKTLIFDAGQPLYADIQGIVASLPNKPLVNDVTTEQYENGCRQIAALFNGDDAAKRVMVMEPVFVPVLEQWFRDTGLWMPLQSATDDSCVELRSMFTSGMAQSSIQMRGTYMVGLIDSVASALGIDAPTKEEALALGDRLVGFASREGLPRLYMRDIREALS